MSTGIKRWIQQVTDRALELLDLGSDGVPFDDLIAQCRAVISRRGEATGLALAGSVVASWRALDSHEHLAFFRFLIDEFGPDKQRLDCAIANYQLSADESSAMALHQAAEAKRQELFRRMNTAPGGLQTLISMREALRD